MYIEFPESPFKKAHNLKTTDLIHRCNFIYLQVKKST